jgi:D-lyxose ketol-isomerase
VIKRSEWEKARDWAWTFVKKAGPVVRDDEINSIEIADLGLNEFNFTGLHILSLFSTECVGAKLLILQPNQFFPEHKHPPLEKENFPGKTEVIRGQWGEFYLYVPGSITSDPKVNPPLHRKKYIDIWHEIIIRPGDQYIISPNTWHWFQAGPEGAIVWSISSKLTDVKDKFKDPQVKRKTIIMDDCSD